MYALSQCLTALFFLISSQQAFSMETTSSSSPKNTQENIKDPQLVKDFKDGDVLYGLNIPVGRKKYQEILKDRFPLNTIDRYNIFSIRLEEDRESLRPDKLHQTIITLVEGSNKFTDYKNKEEISLEIEKYAKAALDRFGFLSRNDEIDEFEILFKLCRFGIDFITGNNGKVRFVLDGYDASHSPAVNKLPSYTDAELVYIRDNWEKLKHNVIFYKKGSPCKEPWGDKILNERLDEVSETIKEQELKWNKK
jgi:hypothetical protein